MVLQDTNENFIIAFPDDGTRKRDLAKGKLTIDFFSGLVTLPDGTTVELRKKLRNSGQKFIRSVVIFCALGSKVQLGNNNPVKVFADQCNWNVFENLAIHKVTIETGFTGTPDENDFQLIASTSRKAIYVPKVVKIHETKRVAAQATTDAYATLFERHTIQFNHISITVAEVGTTNGITYKIEAKQDSADTYFELQGDTTVAASGSDIVQIQGVFHFIKVSIKATVGGSQGSVDGQFAGQG